MQKTVFLLLPLMLVFLLSCQNNDLLQEDIKKDELKITSEKGFRIANSIIDLKKRLAPLILEKSKTNSNFDIIKITYQDIGNYSYATIDYKTPNGIVSNIIITNSPLGMSAEKCDRCECYTVTCSGQECCRAKMILGVDGRPEFECTCASCTMNVRRYRCP
ncbi:MAG: hypothetical protein NW226_20480 [Microscillaceae bacterium]|nr:hypothetical protein [Microscillaceae bacterium]